MNKNQGSTSQKNTFWIYGLHTVKAALLNTERQCHKIIYLQDSFLNELDLSTRPHLAIEKVERQKFHSLFPEGSVHQGVAALVNRLEEKGIEILETVEEPCVVLTLDQITDPHNLGAILRSAAAFGAKALILPDRNTPDENSPIVAKTASGALEKIPVLRVTNLARTLEKMKEYGFWHVGLDEKGNTLLADLKLTGKTNIILGAEGEGLRRLTQENCDFLARLPTSSHFATLNVSNAAAISLYECIRAKITG
jgi:23S rRNA (guanosine2251-2'-O)-methyltransferase